MPCSQYKADLTAATDPQIFDIAWRIREPKSGRSEQGVHAPRSVT